ncbi:MFS transporter [Streptomyces lavendulocolor]|uniref:MFS transporter n=1 Tax=Streptomyces lavendulocolor TaxID=67316 RepID=UPI003C300EF8
MSEAPGSGLLRDRNFVRFWLAATTTGIGSQVTLLALPVLAVTALNADAGELGLLGFLQLLPVIVVTPFAGVIADTYSPKHISVVSMAGRGVLMGLVPLLAFLDTLSMVWLYVIGASSGCLKALGDVVQHSMLPLLVEDSRIVPGNAALGGSRSVVEVSGPGMAGLLVQGFSAPYAVVADAVSFFLAGTLVGSLRMKPRAGPDPRHGWFSRMKSGFVYLGRERRLLMLGVSSGVFNVFIQAYLTLLVLYAVSSLHLSPAAVGATYSVGAVGGIAGAAAANGLGRRLSPVDAINVGDVMTAVGLIVIAAAAAAGSTVSAALVLATGVFLYSFGLGVANVHAVSVRQRICRPDMLGRLTASYRLISHGTLPLGALLGGVGAQFADPAVIICASGIVLLVWVAALQFTSYRDLAVTDTPSRESVRPEP